MRKAHHHPRQRHRTAGGQFLSPTSRLFSHHPCLAVQRPPMHVAGDLSKGVTEHTALQAWFLSSSHARAMRAAPALQDPDWRSKVVAFNATEIAACNDDTENGGYGTTVPTFHQAIRHIRKAVHSSLPPHAAHRLELGPVAYLPPLPCAPLFAACYVGRDWQHKQVKCMAASWHWSWNKYNATCPGGLGIKCAGLVGCHRAGRDTEGFLAKGCEG